MVSVIASGAFNALEFAGAGFMFKMIDGNSYREEMERRAKAAHELAVRKEKFYEEQVLRKNRIEELRLKIAEAEKSEKETDLALARLNKTLLREEERKLREERLPTINDTSNHLMK